MAFVLAKTTPVTASEVRQAMSEAFEGLLGFAPNEAQLTLMVAQSAFETGHWKHIRNYNVGNLKRGSQWGGDHTTFPCSEILSGKLQHFDAGDKHCLFRAYPTLRDGVLDYLSLIVRNQRWKDGLLSGNVHEFVRALSQRPGAYFTDDPAHYESVVRQLVERYRPAAPKDESVASLQKPPDKAVAPLSGRPFYELRVGDQSFMVQLAQRLLNERTLYLPKLRADGAYGPKTEERIRLAKRDLGLDHHTGHVGKNFFQLLARGGD